ncbi:MAG: hypothetical protein WD601_00635 [Pseudohongiellaceae bacterium]
MTALPVLSGALMYGCINSRRILVVLLALFPLTLQADTIRLTIASSHNPALPPVHFLPCL